MVHTILTIFRHLAQSAGGVPFNACEFQSKGDPIRFLRERELVHFQRFGEALRDVQDHLNSRNFYAFNPAFDKMTGENTCQ